jgi:hypothetical protein
MNVIQRWGYCVSNWEQTKAKESLYQQGQDGEEGRGLQFHSKVPLCPFSVEIAVFCLGRQRPRWFIATADIYATAVAR